MPPQRGEEGEEILPRGVVELPAVGRPVEEHVQPLLADERESPGTAAAPAAATTTGVHPLPNASYTCDKRTWASKLVFSWIQPVLAKVRAR